MHGAHVSSCTSRSQGHWIWTALSSILLTRPGTQRLLPISTSEEASSWNAAWRQWWAQAGHGVVSRQHASRILFDWNKGTFWQMSQMCWCEGRLYWKIMQLFCLCRLCIILNCKTFWSPLVVQQSSKQEKEHYKVIVITEKQKRKIQHE